MLGIDNQDFSYFFLIYQIIEAGFTENLFHDFVIRDVMLCDLLSDIWLFTLKGFLMLRCSYNW